VDPFGHVTVQVQGVTISNGIAWSPDGGVMYYIDTPTRTVDAFDFDVAAGVASRRRTLLGIPHDEGTGLPDGLTVDADGHLWVAMWDGGTLRRYRPDGTLDAVIPVGTPRVTSCAFGGPDLDELFITSATVGVDPDVAARTHAGALYRIRPGVRGLPATPFRMGAEENISRPA